MEDIRAMRAATRNLVRELRILDGHGCLPAMSFSECHALYEIGQREGTTVSELTDALLLEKSTVSRIVSSLRRRGLIESRTADGDRRRRRLSLTDAGQQQVSGIDQVSDGQVAGAFSFLTGAERAACIEALARYGKALAYARRAAALKVRPIEPRDNAAMAAVIRQVMTEFGAVGCGFSIEDPEVDALYETYQQPRSCFYVIERGGRVLGGGGIAPLKAGDREVCELQKMYFLSELRGCGQGVPLISRLLDDAREFGFRTCYLETLDHMHQARSLYRRMGFADLDAPMGNTGHYRCNSWMAKEL